jgi:thymidine kinase
LAKLYFSYSTMNAGKSTLLLQASYNYRERGMRTVLFIAAFDDRAGVGRIASRIGLDSEAHAFRPEDDLFETLKRLTADGEIACAFVDEAQFLTEAQVWQLARVADRLKIPVMAYGFVRTSAGNCSRAPRHFWHWLMNCAKSARSVIAGARPPWL